MAAAAGLLLMILGVSQGLSAHCDARKDGVQCNVTLGETVFLQLIANASGIRFDLTKENFNLLKGRVNGTVVNEIKDRSDFTPNNGTFRINDLKNSDSGKYILTVFDPDGKQKETWTFHLSVQAGSSSLKIGLITSSICGVLLFFISLAVIYAWRKKQKRKETEDPTDLTYAVVTTVQKTAGRSNKQKVEEEVEYGQIKSAG